MSKNNLNLDTKKKAIIGGSIALSSLLLFSGVKKEPVKEVKSIESFYAGKEEDKEPINEIVISKNEEEEEEEKVEEIEEDMDERLREIEKIEKTKIYINKNNPEAFLIIDQNNLKEKKFELFEELEAVGENKRYYKVIKEDNEFLVKKIDTSKNRNNIFRNVDKQERFLNKDTSLFLEPNEESQKVDAQINESLTLLGFNEKGFARVNYKGDILYAKTEDISTEKVKLNEIETKIEEVAVQSTETNITKTNIPEATTKKKPKKVVRTKKVPKAKKTQTTKNTVPKKPTKNATKQEIGELGETFNCSFSAYYPENSRLQGGFYDAMGNKLVPANNTCAAPPEIPFGTKLLVQGTGTDKDGKIFTVTDRGGAIKMRPDGTWRVDILTSGYNEAYGFGRRNGTVTIVK